MKFDQTGKFIKPDDWQQQLDALSQKNFNLTVDEHALSPIEVEPGVSGTFDKAVGDMGATHGARGPWGWLEEPMQDPTSGISHQVPATNLTKNLFRGWEENVQGHHVDYTTLSNKFIFKDLPNGLFGDDALPRIGHVMDEAIKLREVDNIPLNTMDELHRLAYEIGRVGRVPTADEVNRFMELLGGGEKVTPFETIVKLQELIPAVPPVEVTPPVEQLAVPPVEVTAPPIPVGWHRPLEEFVATTVPQAAPTAPLEAGITQKITPPAPADKTQPMKPVPPTPAEEETQPSKTTLESLAETQPIRPIATPAPTAPPTPPPAAAPAAPPGPILEASSIFPKQNDYEKLIKDQAPNILKKIRWQLNYMDRTSTQESRPFNPEQALDGLIRSNLAEQLSTILSIPDCPTVFSSGEDSSHLSPTTFTAALGEDTERLSKEQILAQVVRKSIEETPLSNIKKLLQKKYPNEEKRQKAYDQLVEEIVAGYSSTGSGTNAGILYAESVIPDGVLQNAQGEIIGFSEVKTYRPDELDSLKQKLSDQISGEITFIDNLRTVGFGMPALGDDMPMLLRFPSDIPDESLKSLGQDLQKLGFSRVLIQKLPLNSTQLSEISKELVRSNLKQIRRGTIEFSQEGIELLEKYSKPPETLATTIAAPKPVTEKTQPMKPVPPTPAEEETQPSKTTLESLAETQPIRPIATSATRPITPTPPVSPEPIPAPQPEPAITETQPIQVAVAPEKPSPATKPAPKEEVSETGIPQKVEAPPPSAVPLPAAEALQETQKIKPVAPPVSPPEAPQTPTATPMVQAAPAPILTEAPAPEAMPTGDVRTRMRDALNQADQAKTDTTTMQLSPDDFLEFAKSMTLPYGTTIMGGNIRIRGNELIIDNVVLNIPTKGEAKVNARYRADEKGLIMDQYKAHLDGLNLNFLEKGLVPGIIQNTMKALELKLKEVINQAIGLPWNATLIGISGNNLTVMFQKRRK
ncbi:hypothetical protein HYV22_03385 [Candidatus Gottesmanbacteria bacterium]|nr:hypothetical protein [Candidatus Gottesmanbacteria bacterium]